MESREEIDESGTEPKFFKTEISQNTDGNRGNFAYDDFARLEFIKFKAVVVRVIRFD
jgi:hypothetical protein